MDNEDLVKKYQTSYLQLYFEGVTYVPLAKLCLWISIEEMDEGDWSRVGPLLIVKNK